LIIKVKKNPINHTQIQKVTKKIVFTRLLIIISMAKHINISNHSIFNLSKLFIDRFCIRRLKENVYECFRC